MFTTRRGYYGNQSVIMFKRRPALFIAVAFLSFILATSFILSYISAGRTDDEWRQEVEFYAKMNRWKFAVIADMDHASKTTNDDGDVYWRSYLQKGSLTRDKNTGKYSFKMDDTKIELPTNLNEKGRGMELSDLVEFNGKLYTCDDRSGIVYEIINDKPIPRTLLMDGNGVSQKGFKCEWGTVKDDFLYIGSFGKEFTTDQGEILNDNPMWVKKLSKDLVVEHFNWSSVYQSLRKATNTVHPGYLFHESCHWNPILNRWYFLPRRASTEPYEPKLDESRGSNLVISTNEDFEDVTIMEVGHPTRGFSCFRFVPGRSDEILAIKSEEVGDQTASFIMIFNLKGEILLEETQFAKGLKYEGLEFLDLETENLV